MHKKPNDDFRVRESLAGGAGEVLRHLSSEFPQLPAHELEILLEEALRVGQGWEGSRSDLLGGGMSSPVVTIKTAHQIREWSRQRLSGIPLQHLTGWQVFLDHRYRVGPQVLIPRPETEGLVSIALESLKKLTGRLEISGLELGLGSGIISVELLSAYSNLKMLASEISKEATDLALQNAHRILGQQQANARLQVVSDLEAACMSLEKADFLISNPPYLDPEQEGAETTEEVRRYEPRIALFGPKGDPSFFYRKFAELARKWLKKGGLIFLEIPHERSVEIVGFFSSTGWKQIEILKDLAGRSRYLVAENSQE